MMKNPKNNEEHEVKFVIVPNNLGMSSRLTDNTKTEFDYCQFGTLYR